MKKTKIAAIVACAALLVLGMAFTAMAANKWVYQDGGWYAVDKDGDIVGDAWVKGEDGIAYWADSDGLWSTDASSLDGDVYHFRDKNGLECDAVVHLPNGKYGLVEVKIGGTDLISEGAESLKKLASYMVCSSCR